MVEDENHVKTQVYEEEIQQHVKMIEDPSGNDRFVTFPFMLARDCLAV